MPPRLPENGHAPSFKLQLATVRKHINVHAQLRSLSRHSEVARDVIRSADIVVHADALGGGVLRSVHHICAFSYRAVPFLQ
ncbi:hypothetical protein C6Q28_26810 [Burkholderia multivorans]|nr:hypothetical protein CA831_05875 [Burkholderia multivorans]OXH94111.1 hypothetical protein CA830_03730 [Burkholderia multivorans]PRF02830.1 hypothetical protein C6Q07_20520 [Burkholderia multivorans]PRF52591.1 hypothetical protein C6Q28_26810 [Burkholderia multivorans]